MPISRREMEFFVNSHIHSLDDETLVKVAETVLAKTVTLRGRRFSVKKEAPADIPGMAVAPMTQIDVNQASNSKGTPMAKLTAPQIEVLLDILDGKDRFADRYAPAAKVVALGLATWSGKSSPLSNDRLILTDEGMAMAKLERTKRKEA